MHEFARIDALQALLRDNEAAASRQGAALSAPTPLVGNGDDAAVLPAGAPTAVSVDAAVEGVHFRRHWLSAAQLGQRAVGAALSDLAAMAAEPEAVLLSLALPKGLPDAQLLALVDGAQQAALAVGARLVGGNLSSAEALALHTTVVGRSPGRILQRRGARVSDGIFISGPLGGAAAGLAALLQRDRQTPSDMPGPDLTPFITRWQAPSPHFEAARRALRAGATAAIDLSDGLVQDLSHLCRASAVGATLHLAALPQAPGLAAAAAALGQDVNPWLLSGGEDYVLLLTLPAGAPRVSGLWRIGAITEDTGQVRVLDANGHPVPCDQGGFVHRG